MSDQIRAGDFVRAWELYPHPELKERLLEMGRENAPRPSHPGANWEIKNEVKPAELFFYLGARFGQPNGLMNWLRGDHSDNLIHWEWSLRFGSALINIQGMNFRTEIFAIGGDLALNSLSAAELAAAIREDFANHRRGMVAIREALEDWTEFANPYQRIRRSLSTLLDRLRELRLSTTAEMQDALDGGEDWEAQRAKWGEMTERYTLGLGLCFGIRSMLPVMAEAFVNLLMYVLMRPDIKGDKRLRENAFRQHIDVRVKSLSINCLGFDRPVDYATDVCKEFHRLVNERNDLLHGNVAIDKLKFNEVYFWGKVPVFQEYRSMWDRSVGVEVKVTGLENLEGEVVVVEDFIRYVMSCLHPDARQHVEAILKKSHLGFNEKTGGLGVLFGDHLVDMRMAPPTGSEAHIHVVQTPRE